MVWDDDNVAEQLTIIEENANPARRNRRVALCKDPNKSSTEEDSSDDDTPMPRSVTRPRASVSRVAAPGVAVAAPAPAVAPAVIAAVETSVCRELHTKSGNNKTLLLAMVQGLKDDERFPGDLGAAPHESLEASEKPKKKDFSLEVIRRGNVLKSTDKAHRQPKPGGWHIDKLKEWLLRTPVTCAHDVAFLKSEEGACH